MTRTIPTRATARYALLRARAWPILQTAGAAVAAWYLAELLLPDEEEPVFASIAAVIAIGATYGQRRERALELVGGVVVGIAVADLLISAIGSGPLQLGLLVVLAMSAAVLLGGGPVLVTEAGVSAILLVLLEPATSGVPPPRLVEALVGGGVALAISALAFPLNPVLLVGRSTQAIFGELGRTLEELAAALADGDRERAERALTAARDIDALVRELDDALAIGLETARYSPGRRSTRGNLDRYARSARHIDFAVRNTRVLARHVARFLRRGRSSPEQLPEAIRDLGLAVWALAAAVEEPSRGVGRVRRHASRAAALATRSYEAERELGLAEIVVQVRSTAIDLVRAEEASAAGAAAAPEPSTEELLLDAEQPRPDGSLTA
jgi:uncharacterized membrane protein YgaE (UPF0421/DUF939 family)